jgi:hypothetical protein
VSTHRQNVIELLRSFAQRTARERVVADYSAREQLALINGLARKVLAIQEAR